MFRKLSPGVIAVAVVSDELRGASVLSLCIDQFKQGEEEDDGRGDVGDLAAALEQCPALKQLCFLQGPDRDSDDAFAHFCTQLLQLWAGQSGGDWEWLRGITIYPTCAFSTSLRSREFLTTTESTRISSISPVTGVFPVIHIFIFTADAYQYQQHQNSYSDHYTLENTLLDAERIAVRFLSYLRSIASGSGLSSDKAILRFAYGGLPRHSPPSTTTTTTTTTHSHHAHNYLAGSLSVPPPSGISTTTSHQTIRQELDWEIYPRQLGGACGPTGLGIQISRQRRRQKQQYHLKILLRPNK